MKLDQNRVPLFDAVLNHAKNDITSFHTPGHKNGESIARKFLDFVGEKIFRMDLTVFPELDSIHDPVGIIKEAEDLYSELVGSDETFFLLNGSSMGNQVMFLSSCNPGDSVIISRNAHKSAMSGIVLSGVWPIWIQPKLDKDFDVFFDSSPEQIEKALNKFPEAKAVFITNPTYNGVITDIKEIARIVHDYGKILLVDEAHGAHLGFSDILPSSAVNLGADMVVQSTHKTLSALSQASVLHYNNTGNVDVNRVQKVVSLLQTTSPNYIILASLDLARKQMFLKGAGLVKNMVKHAEYLISKEDRFSKFKFLKQSDVLAKGYDLDSTKVTINVTQTGLDGYFVSELLAKDYSIQFDCADFFNLIAILGVGSTRKDMDRLIAALEDIEKKYEGDICSKEIRLPSLTTEMVLSPREVFLSNETELVYIEEAAGYISAQKLTPYPPGIPVLIPGERITKEICDYLKNMDAKSIRVSGQEKKKLDYIKVVRN